MYLIIQQIDTISGSGCITTLTLQRVAGDTEESSGGYQNYSSKVNKVIPPSQKSYSGI